jgi:hypothetical protein
MQSKKLDTLSIYPQLNLFKIQISLGPQRLKDITTQALIISLAIWVYKLWVWKQFSLQLLF